MQKVRLENILIEPGTARKLFRWPSRKAAARADIVLLAG